jgi:endoglycosylceramidase
VRRGLIIGFALGCLTWAGIGAGVASARLLPLHATRGSDPAIFDAAGRQVLLHGVGDNQLGDYYQVDPAQATVFPLGKRDFDLMHRLGFNVVRLALSWSKLEPQRGQISEAYIRRIRDAVEWAKGSGLYVILEMHQDAWGKEVATPPGETCPPGLTPSIGWDGAPTWATYFDGMSSCHNTFRELSPAVAAAFDNFYDDRDGIQTQLVRVWARLAQKFAANPTVAGFDLFNEPHPGSRPGPVAAEEIGSFYERSIEAIRRAESERTNGFHHIIFFEPSVLYNVVVSPAVAPPPTFTDDQDIVFAPHLYPGTFSPFSTDQAYQATEAIAASYQTTFWVGEWGWYSQDPSDDYANIRDFAAHEDEALVGDAWWQWRQRCGDPHEFGNPGSAGRPIADGLNRYRCPGDHPIGIPPTTRQVLGRSYALAAPGRIESLHSDPATEAFQINGSDPDPTGSCRLEVWTPTSPTGRPRFVANNIGRIRTHPLAGGWLTTGCARGSYELRRRLLRFAPSGRRSIAGSANLPSIPY